MNFFAYMKDLLCLILAGGKSTRVREFLNEEEPIKQMFFIDEKRLIEHTFDLVQSIRVEKAVLSRLSDKHRLMNSLVNERGFRLLYEKAPLVKISFFVELPLVILYQYWLSSDHSYLRTFRSIMTIPSDLFFVDVDFTSFIEHHFRHLKAGKKNVFSFLSKRSTGEGRSFYFKLDGDRIIKCKKANSQPPSCFISYTQSGAYIFTTSFLRNPLLILKGLKGNIFTLYETNGTWIDYGDPATIKRLRGE